VLVFNASESTRRRWSEQKSGVKVVLRAQEIELWRGTLRNVSHEHLGPNWVTTITSGDGDSSPVSFTAAQGSTLGAALKRVAQEMQVGISDLFSAVRLPSPVAVHGRSMDELERLIRGQGKELSVQSGQVQVLDKGATLAGTAVVSQATGLEGSPLVGSDKTGKFVKFTHLIAPELIPGRRVRIEAVHVQGEYRIERCDWSSDWSVSCLCRPVKV